MTQVLLSGDSITLKPAFGAATLAGGLVLPVEGTAHPTCAGNALVLPADVEAMVWLLSYTTPTHSTPGTGRAQIVMDSVALTQIATAGDTALVLSEPGEVEVEFSVMVAAMAPGSPPTPDGTATYRGTAEITAPGPRPTAT